jgi:hypothetical protein
MRGGGWYSPFQVAKAEEKLASAVVMVLKVWESVCLDRQWLSQDEHQMDVYISRVDLGGSLPGSATWRADISRHQVTHDMHHNSNNA